MKHFFYKGSSEVLKEKKDITFDDTINLVKKEFAKVLESRNLSFLIGSGCSLGNGGIPTMKELAQNFFAPTEQVLNKMSAVLKKLVLTSDCKQIVTELGIHIDNEPFNSNLETFLGTLYSLRYYYLQINNDAELGKVEKVITQTKSYILYQCLNTDNKNNDGEISGNYKNFYRKLSLRDSNLPKPNIFSTNYDLYSERAMDELGITYTNGFSGFIERYFNPSIFNYALAEQMDISSFKWNVIDSFIYLFKIHGSVNWVEVEDSNKLFKIKELQESDFDTLRKQSNLMIYPSPIKQNASLGTPYSDLFREFQKRIAQKQSILVTMGYSFSDEHINNLIYQDLTIPTFRLVVFSELGYYKGDKYSLVKANIDRIAKLNDPRIWIIGSDEEFKDDDKWEKVNPEMGLYYFNTIANVLLPDWSENQIEEKNDKIIEMMKAVVSSGSKNPSNDQG